MTLGWIFFPTYRAFSADFSRQRASSPMRRGFDLIKLKGSVSSMCSSAFSDWSLAAQKRLLNEIAQLDELSAEDLDNHPRNDDPKYLYAETNAEGVLALVNEWSQSSKSLLLQLQSVLPGVKTWRPRWFIKRIRRWFVMVQLDTVEGLDKHGRDRLELLDFCGISKIVGGEFAVWTTTEEARRKIFDLEIHLANGGELGDSVGAGETVPLTDLWPDGVPTFYYSPIRPPIIVDADETAD